MKPRVRSVIRKLAVLLFWLMLWALAAAAVGQELLLPTPLRVAQKLVEMAAHAEFWLTVGRSILRVLTGILAAAALGLLLAVLTYESPLAMELLSPIMALIKSTPVASFIILALVWLGRSIVPVVIAGMMVLPVVWANAQAGLQGVDRQLLELARVYGLPRLRVLRRIVWPAVLPHMQAAFRSAMGLGWKAGIAAEVLTVPPYSIGKQIYEAKIYLETTELFAWTAAVVILSVLIERTLLLLVRKTRRKGEDRA